jgi:putative methyltransferase (TIGR04325 family)
MHELAQRLMRRIRRPAETIVGYEQPELVEVIFQKTLAYQPQETTWTEMVGASSVLDFGGGCGLHYKQARSPTVRWAVIETPAMVERAKVLATDRLQFFTDISEAAVWLGDIDVMHSNGSLQYASDPEQKLQHLCNLKAKTMLWYRMLLGAPGREAQTSLLGDNGPGSLRVKEKIVRYDRTRISELTFLDAHTGYVIAERAADWFRFVKAPA